MRRPGNPKKWRAKVLCDGKICDLALLTVEEEDFWTADLVSLQFVDVPELQVGTSKWPFRDRDGSSEPDVLAPVCIRKQAAWVELQTELPLRGQCRLQCRGRDSMMGDPAAEAVWACCLCMLLAGA